MEPYSVITDNHSSFEQLLSIFHDAGLVAVLTKGDSALKVIGGSEVKCEEMGYEIAEPVFSIFFKNAQWIAVTQDMSSIHDKNISKICMSLDEAVEFICNAYMTNSSARSRNRESYSQ